MASFFGTQCRPTLTAVWGRAISQVQVMNFQSALSTYFWYRVAAEEQVLHLADLARLRFRRLTTQQTTVKITLAQLNQPISQSINRNYGTQYAVKMTRKPSRRKSYARQQCVYEGLGGKNLSSAGNPTLEPNITSIGKPVAKLWPFPRWPSATGFILSI